MYIDLKMTWKGRS